MRPASFTVLGIDVGGTKIAAGLVELPLGRVLARRQIPTRPERGAEAVLEDVRWLASVLIAEGGAGSPAPVAIGIGLCELVSPEGVILSQNAIHWSSGQVIPHLQHFGPVVIEADVRAAARAEFLFGAGRGLHSFVYVTIGTGIASCFVLEGHPYLGERGATGSLASSPITLPCDCCGQTTRRTLEEIASGPAWVARFRDAGGEGALSAQDVLAAADAGDSRAAHVVLTAAESLGTAIGLLVNVLDPGAVIIGGGLGLCGGRFWCSLEESVRRQIWSPVHRDLPILQASTGADAGLMGAAQSAADSLGLGSRTAEPGQ